MILNIHEIKYNAQNSHILEYVSSSNLDSEFRIPKIQHRSVELSLALTQENSHKNDLENVPEI